MRHLKGEGWRMGDGRMILLQLPTEKGCVSRFQEVDSAESGFVAFGARAEARHPCFPSASCIQKTAVSKSSFSGPGGNAIELPATLMLGRQSKSPPGSEPAVLGPSIAGGSEQVAGGSEQVAAWISRS